MRPQPATFLLLTAAMVTLVTTLAALWVAAYSLEPTAALILQANVPRH